MMLKLMYTIAALLLFATAALAEEKPRCEYCNMFWGISSTRIDASLKAGGKNVSHKFESIGCLYNWAKENDATVTSAKILDYATFDSKSPKMIDAKSAHYLYGTKRLKGSMAPFAAAFSSKDAAGKAKGDLGGEYMTYADVWKKLEGGNSDKVTACACGNPGCTGCAAGAAAGCSCPNCAGKGA